MKGRFFGVFRNVKILVGELDFSFHAISTTDASRSESSLVNDKLD
jgi:hypothetical protein